MTGTQTKHQGVAETMLRSPPAAGPAEPEPGVRSEPATSDGRVAAARTRPLVSVVTPAYNEEAYLGQCIESVLAQTYPHWEYTIVNNRSTDRTLEIAQSYAAKDKRIRVHTNEAFVPVIANYNIAFRQISPQSKYCKVVSADDFIFPDCLEKMVDVAERHPTVAIVTAYRISGEAVVPVGLPYPVEMMPGRDVARMHLSRGPHLLTAPTAMFFRSDIVRAKHQFFTEPALQSDVDACLEALIEHDFGFVHQILTYERIRPSLSTPVTQRNDYLAHRLEFLMKYGPRLLGPADYDSYVKNLGREYYAYLGRRAVRRPGAEFWAFHRERLAALWRPMSIPRVAAHAALSWIERLLQRLHDRL